MIPVRLVLKDFLSYASPEPLDFTTFDIACLSGDNGVGKTALLDAITWACFGAARGCEGGQNQDRLIRDGADETSVDFTFSLSDATYRIVRRRSRAGKADLQFLVADADGWKNVAAETLKQTEAKIGSVLRMDYRTFTASALFVQGRSDDFLARMKPDERKEVFGRLLDLGTYERLEDAARARAREADVLRKDLARRIEDLAADAPDAAVIVRELDTYTSDLEVARSALGEADAAVRSAREALHEQEMAQALLEKERERLASTVAAARQARNAAEVGRRELAELDQLLARRDETTEALAEIAQLQADETAARADQQRAVEIERRCTEITATIDGERRRLSERAAATRERADTLQRDVQQLDTTRTDLERLDALLAQSADLDVALERLATERREHEVAVARAEEQVRSADEAIAKIKRSLEVLAGGGGECPVCGTALDGQHRTQARKRLQDEMRATNAAKRSIRATLETSRKEAKRCTEDVARLERSMREREEHIASRQGLVAKLEREPVLQREMADLLRSAEEDDQAVRSEAFCTDLRAELTDLEARRLEVYDASAHARIEERLAQLRPYEALSGRITEAVRRHEPLTDEIDATERRAADLETELLGIERSVEEFATRTAGLDDARRTVAEREQALETAQATVSDLTSRAARTQERLASAQRVAKDIEAMRAAESDAATNHRRHRRLAEAFGRGGIPDRIIDNALPELEEDANRILGALTDHEMSVRFVLQRETKSGKAKETFEALVHHEGAVRDFAMFSGGEAFRVAFAVRLAMSKLLVRRAGARLETLVIDEGFGTQDPVGRERLVEAINVARGEFAKVLVITHLDELKDQFGTQIRVEKVGEGSVLKILSA